MFNITSIICTSVRRICVQVCKTNSGRKFVPPSSSEPNRNNKTFQELLYDSLRTFIFQT